MLNRFSAESVVWTATVLLVFVSCGTSLLGADRNWGNETLVSGGLVVENTADNPFLAKSVVGIVPRFAVHAGQSQEALESAVMCTGVVLANELVLTAAHCFEGLEASAAAVYFPFAPFGDRFGLVQSLDIHPAYDPRLPTDNKSTIPPSDLALLRMSRGLPMGYKPALAAQFDGGKDAHQALPDRFLIAGFGVTLSRATRDGGKLRSATINLERTDAQRYLIETAGGTRSAPVGGCAGDSGAPLLQPEGGVVGILSTGGEIAGKCVGTNSFTDVRYYSEWLRNSAAAQGQSIGFFAPRSNPGGSAAVGGVRVDVDSFRAALQSGSSVLPLSVTRLDAAMTTESAGGNARCHIELLMEYSVTRDVAAAKMSSRWRSPSFQFGKRDGIAFGVPAPITLPESFRVVPSMSCDDGFVKVEPAEIGAF